MTSPTFGADVSTDTTLATVALRGELDLATVADLSSALAPLVHHRCTDVVLDVADLEFIDSTGLGAVVRFANELRAHGGTVRIRAPKPGMRRLLDLSGLSSSFPIEDA